MFDLFAFCNLFSIIINDRIINYFICDVFFRELSKTNLFSAFYIFWNQVIYSVYLENTSDMLMVDSRTYMFAKTKLQSLSWIYRTRMKEIVISFISKQFTEELCKFNTMSVLPNLRRRSRYCKRTSFGCVVYLAPLAKCGFR